MRAVAYRRPRTHDGVKKRANVETLRAFSLASLPPGLDTGAASGAQREDIARRHRTPKRSNPQTIFSASGANESLRATGHHFS